MRRSDSDSPFATAAAPTTVRRRRPRVVAELSDNYLIYIYYLSWVRLSTRIDAAAGAVFAAGAGLALLDHIARAEPPFAGALRLRLRLALRAPRPLWRKRPGGARTKPLCATGSISLLTAVERPAPRVAFIGCSAGSPSVR